MSDDTDTLVKYMHNIAQYKLLTPKQEVELAKRISQGDANARETMISSNLRLVVKISHDFKGRGLPLTDLISEGNLGLMRAVEKFDPSKGAKLSSYAAWWIKQSMRRAISNHARTVRVPCHATVKIARIRKAVDDLQRKLGRAPSNDEVSAVTGYSASSVKLFRNSGAMVVSLSQEIPNDPSERTYGDLLSCDAPSRDRDSIDMMLKFVDGDSSVLTDREKTIIVKRYGLDGEKIRTLEEVAQEVHCTRERVRQLQNESIRKIRTAMQKVERNEAI